MKANTFFHNLGKRFRTWVIKVRCGRSEKSGSEDAREDPKRFADFKQAIGRGK